MCGRYYVDDEDMIIEMREIIVEINRKNNGQADAREVKTGDIYPTYDAPVLGEDGASLMRWGMPMHGRSIINARSETAAEKYMFAVALKGRRIAVPTNGYYEWMHEGKKTVGKYLFNVAGQGMVYLAGLWSIYTLPDGTQRPCYAILTTAANDSMAPYHDRMPVYLRGDECATWVRDSGATRDILHRSQPMYSATRVDVPDKGGQMRIDI